jgi:6-phosphogluconate dehydrogenase
MMGIGIAGLGPRGTRLAYWLMGAGYFCAVYDCDTTRVRELARAGASGCDTLGDLVRALEPPRIVWLVPEGGHISCEAVEDLAGLLEKGDVLAESAGMNPLNYLRHERLLAERGVDYLYFGITGSARWEAFELIHKSFIRATASGQFI